MANELTINVTNATNAVQGFQIFNDIPQVSTGDTGSVYMNTWGTSAEVNAQGSGEDGVATFSITADFYAVCGAAPSELTKNLNISTKNTGAATLTSTNQPGSNWTVEIPKGSDNGPIFSPTGDAGTSDVLGGFTINTQVGRNDGWDPSDYPNAFCGIARDSPVPGGGSQIVPTAVWTPKSHQTYRITPTRVFYISYGQQVSGLQTSVVDIGDPVKIDFTGIPHSTAAVTLGADYSWSTVTYS